jgi:asparagine synthase (glutamine-hydrolysing)
MCGIAGVVRSRGGITRADVLAMALPLAHRGPDEGDAWVSPDGAVGLGHRRLSIIDPTAGQQPMCNEDGSIWIVFNGEIYNDPALRSRLEARGHRFKTQCDTESILHLYEDEGDDCVRHLRGMFAFALFDLPRRKLLLARDRIGKKPLYYGQLGDSFVFGSELKALRALPGVDSPVDWSFLDAYWALGYVPAPLTPFKGLYKLPQAHALALEAGQPMRVWCYWEPAYEPKRPFSADEALEELDQRLREAVRIRLRSDVPFGAFLSGGVDSSTVVTLMSQILPHPVKTFSIGFEESSLNELPYARDVAQRVGADHHEAVVRMGDLSILPDLARFLDEPFSDASIIPTYHVSRNARQVVKMVLSGDGGDELFGGYTRYVNQRRMQRLAPLAAVLRPWHGALERHAISGGAAHRLAWMASHATQTFEGSYESSVGKLSVAARQALMLHQEPAGEPWLLPWLKRYASLSLEDRMMAVDLHSYLSEDVLTKVDRMSMANSLEVRAPLLDHELAEFAAALPVSLKIKGATGKWLLKRYAEKLLTPELINRPKQGFAVPLSDWFNGQAADMLRELMDGERDLVRQLFRVETIERWLKQHAQGGINHAERLWAVLMLLQWHRSVVRGL